MDHRRRWPALLAAGLVGVAAVPPLAAAGTRTAATERPVRWSAGWSELAGLAGRIAAPFGAHGLPDPVDAAPLVLRERPTVASLLAQPGDRFAREPALFALDADWSLRVDAPSIRTWNSMPWSIPVGVTVSRWTTMGENRVALGAGLRSWQDTPDAHSRRWAVGLSMGISF